MCVLGRDAGRRLVYAHSGVSVEEAASAMLIRRKGLDAGFSKA